MEKNLGCLALLGFFVIAASLMELAFIALPADVSAQSQPPAVAMVYSTATRANIITAVPTGTPVPTLTPTRAPDIGATQIAGVVYTATVSALQTQTRHDMETQIAIDASNGKTATAIPATETAQAKVAAVSLSEEMRNVEQRASAERAKIQAEKDLNALIVNIEYFGAYVVSIAVSIILALVIFRLVLNITEKQAKIAQIAAMASNITPASFTPVVDPLDAVQEVVQVGGVDSSGYGGGFLHTVLSSREKSIIQRKLKEGRKLSLQPETGMTPLENGFSRQHLENIIDRLEKAGMVIKLPKKAPEWTATGREYIGEDFFKC